MSGRFAKMSNELELTRIQLEEAEILAKKIEVEARALAPRSKETPPDGQQHFADTLKGKAIPTGLGFEVSLTTSMGQLRDWLRKGTADHGPVTAQALVFQVNGDTVFATHVKGIKPNDWEERLKVMVWPEARQAGGKIGSRLVKGLSGRP